MSIETAYEHIVVNDDVPIIEATGIKVSQLVIEHMAHGWSASELRYQHPDLTLGQIHSALAYYWDQQTAVDAEIERCDARVDQIRKSVKSGELQDRLARNR
jgi:uncharacterized protein (DUF433 family)